MGEYWLDAAIGLVTGAAGWFAGSRMRKAQTSSIEFENYRAFVETNNRIIESLRVQVTGFIERENQLSAKVDKLQSENSELRQKVKQVEDEMRTLKRTYPCDNCPKL